MSTLNLLAECLPLRLQSLHIGGELLFGGTLSCGANDHTRALGKDFLEDGFQTRALGVRELPRDSIHGAAWHINQVSTGQADLACEPGTLVANGVFGDLHEDAIPGLQSKFNASWARCPALRRCFPVNLTGVEHSITTAADIHEGCLHARQHVLHATEIDVANQARLF